MTKLTPEDKASAGLKALIEAETIIIHEAAKLATAQELPACDAEDYPRHVPKWMLYALERLQDRMRGNAISLKKAADLIRDYRTAQTRTPIPAQSEDAEVKEYDDLFSPSLKIAEGDIPLSIVTNASFRFDPKQKILHVSVADGGHIIGNVFDGGGEIDYVFSIGGVQ